MAFGKPLSAIEARTFHQPGSLSGVRKHQRSNTHSEGDRGRGSRRYLPKLRVAGSQESRTGRQANPIEHCARLECCRELHCGKESVTRRGLRIWILIRSSETFGHARVRCTVPAVSREFPGWHRVLRRSGQHAGWIQCSQHSPLCCPCHFLANQRKRVAALLARCRTDTRREPGSPALWVQLRDSWFP